MKRTINDIIRTMEASGYMLSTMLTPSARIRELCDFQNLCLRLLFNDDHATNLRYTDALAHISQLAENKGLSNHPTIAEAVADMEAISREIGTAFSGASGERMVAQVAHYANRDIHLVSNVILSEGDKKTELDHIVVTSEGLLLLEVKNYKKDLILSEAGMVCDAHGKPFPGKALATQMSLKRYLLRTKLEKLLAETNPHIQLHIDSCIVFSCPTINIIDNYQKENYCFCAALPNVIEAHSSPVTWSTEEMRAIVSAIKSIAEEEDLYPVGMDFDRIRRTFAEALVLLESEPEEEFKEALPSPTERKLAELTSRAELAEAKAERYKDTATASGIVAAVGLLFAGIILASKK